MLRFFRSHHGLIAAIMFGALMMMTAEAGSSEGHPHSGKVKPFEAGDPKVDLDGKARSILSDGEPYQTQIQKSGSSGRGLVVQDVKAPTNIVWDKILDQDNYAKMVPKTVESEIYNVEKDGKKDDSPQTIYTRMKVGFPMVKLQFFVKHKYQPKLNSLTWTLDYTKKSDFDDSCGYWYVVEHPDNPNWSRVYYSVEVSMFDWVPKFVVEFMSKKALTDATGWVKKFSEKEYEKQGGDKKSKGDGASDKSSSSSSSSDDKNKKRFFGLFGSRNDDGSSTSDTDDESCDSPGKTTVESRAKSVAALTSKGSVDEAPSKQQVGLQRYALVLSVTVLFMYNIHLYFSV